MAATVACKEGNWGGVNSVCKWRCSKITCRETIELQEMNVSSDAVTSISAANFKFLTNGELNMMAPT